MDAQSDPRALIFPLLFLAITFGFSGLLQGIFGWVEFFRELFEKSRSEERP